MLSSNWILEKNMRKKYIFVTDARSDDYGILSDLHIEENPDLELHIARHSSPKTKIGKKLQHVYFSGKINYYFHLPFHYFFSTIRKMYIDKETEYIFIILNGALSVYDYKIWNKLKRQHPNIRTVLILLDSLNVKTFFGKMIRRDVEKVQWDLIYTVDKNDSEKYKFNYLNEHYYSDKRELIKPNLNPKNDVYMIGSLKPGRVELLKRIHNKFRQEKISSDFTLVVPSNYQKTQLRQELSGVKFINKFKKYNDVLKELQNSNVIIEILQQNQGAPTLRYFEAVMFNKKLLTNNQNVKKLKFYNEDYIKVFKNVEDIDFEWIKKKEKINYHYTDEFSPTYLLEEIRKKYE